MYFSLGPLDFGKTLPKDTSLLPGRSDSLNLTERVTEDTLLVMTGRGP